MELIDKAPYLRLRTVSEPLHPFEDIDRILEVSDELCRYMEKTSDCAGISAIQFGENIRLFVIRSKYGLITYVNPSIIGADYPERQGWEGCMSFPGMGALVKRSHKISISAHGVSRGTGRERHCYPMKQKLSGLHSRVFQHELDHLDGKVMFDRAEVLEGTPPPHFSFIYASCLTSENLTDSPLVFDYFHMGNQTYFFQTINLGMFPFVGSAPVKPEEFGESGLPIGKAVGVMREIEKGDSGNARKETK